MYSNHLDASDRDKISCYWGQIYTGKVKEKWGNHSCDFRLKNKAFTQTI